MQIPNQNVDIFTSSDKRTHVTVKSKYTFQKALKVKTFYLPITIKIRCLEKRYPFMMQMSNLCAYL